MTTKEAWHELLSHTRPLRHLTSVAHLVAWDQEVLMPDGGAAPRASQAAVVSSLAHERLTGRPLQRALGRLVDLRTGEPTARGLSALQKDALREQHRRWARAKKLPTAHVAEAAGLYSEAQSVWSRARAARAFKPFLPYLRRIVALKRREAEHLGYAGVAYDALLDEFEPGAAVADLDPLMARLAPSVRDLALRSARRAAPKAIPRLDRRPTPAEAAAVSAFSRELVAEMGFDFTRGRIDAAEHPSTTGLHPHDVRFTVRRQPQTLLDEVFTSLHEGGHALYDQGLDPAGWGTPLAEYVSLGVHESQSRLWENVVGRSREFWRTRLPRLARALPELKGVPLDAFMASLWRVAPARLRLESDEVTYNLHIVLRYELEKALISGDLDAGDVPQAWSDTLHALLGLRPRHEGEGCLQDIHWSSGSIGYFPTYVLGNLFASQLFDAYRHERPRWRDDLQPGKLTALTLWLNAKVHRHGARFPASRLIERSTGSPLSAEPFLAHLEARYAD